MSAFDKVPSGLPGMDKLLDYIRMGDNVVWQVTTLDEFLYFARTFAAQSIADGRNLIYMRFRPSAMDWAAKVRAKYRNSSNVVTCQTTLSPMRI